MNILYLINELQLGGSQLGAIKEITELTNKGHNITVISRNGVLKETFEKVSNRVEIVNLPLYGFAGEILDRKGKIKNDFMNFMKSLRKCRLLRSVVKVVNVIREEKIDVIYSCQPGPTQVAHISSIITKVPFIIRIQHILANEFAPLLHKKVVKDSYKISVITEEIMQHLNKNYNVQNKDVCIIPTCIDLEQYINIKDEYNIDCIKNLGIKPSDTIVVSITTHRDDKMRPIKSLISTIEKLNRENINVKCILVGDGPCQKIVEDLSEKVNLRVEDSIIIPVGKQMDLKPFLDIADLGIGVGRCAMEFLASRNALICASHQAFGGLFTKERANAIAGYNFSGRNTMDISDEENMYKSIKEYINMSIEERDNINSFGQEFILQNYRTNSIMDKTEKLLYDAIKQ